MQKHKYRAYIEEYDEILPVLFIDFVNNAFCVIPTAELEGGNQIEIKDRMNLLDQFTGKRDNNGKDIYKNDIIKTNTGIIGVIDYNSNYACFIIKTDKNEHVLYTDEIEIIGNKYQNSELLNNKKESLC